MTKYYAEDEVIAAKKHRDKLRIIFFTVLGIYLAANLALYIYFLGLPYGAGRFWLIFTHGVLALGFFLFAFIFMGIKYNRVKRYYRVLNYIEVGLKDSYSGEFLRFSEEDEIKDGLEFYSMILKQWNGFKQEYFERMVLLDKDKPFPGFKEGQKINYKTNGNILVEYEVEE